jgi:hypothetical protein
MEGRVASESGKIDDAMETVDDEERRKNARKRQENARICIFRFSCLSSANRVFFRDIRAAFLIFLGRSRA